MKLGAMNNPKEELFNQIDFFASNGFDYLELTIEPPMAYPLSQQNITDIVEQLSSHNLGIIAHLPWHFHLSYPLDDVLSIYRKHFFKCIDFASDVGAKQITVHPEFLPHLSNDRNQVISQLKESLAILKDSCRSSGMDLLFENFIQSTYSNHEFFSIAQELDLGITFDIGHSFIHRGMEGIFSSIELFGPRIKHIHVHDNLGDRDSHLPIGAGSILWPKLIQKLKPFSDYSFTLEVHSSSSDYLLLSKKIFSYFWKQTESKVSE